jgi:hypothetical protein
MSAIQPALSEWPQHHCPTKGLSLDATARRNLLGCQHNAAMIELRAAMVNVANGRLGAFGTLQLAETLSEALLKQARLETPPRCKLAPRYTFPRAHATVAKG